MEQLVKDGEALISGETLGNIAIIIIIICIIIMMMMIIIISIIILTIKEMRMVMSGSK